MALVKKGAGWARTSKSNEKFISLDLDGRKLLLFKNKKKEKDSQPDYLIMESNDEPTAAVIKTETPDTAMPPDEVDHPF